MEKIPITSQPGSEALPSGLKDLESLEEITVHQHLEAGDMCFQRPSRYSVYGKEDDSILYAQEVSECYARQCLGAMRAFVLKFSNQEGQDLIRLRRPLRCPCGVCWWWCCCVQELSIESPPGQEIGVIMEERCCCPVYKIIDEMNLWSSESDFPAVCASFAQMLSFLSMMGEGNNCWQKSRNPHPVTGVITVDLTMILSYHIFSR